MTTEITTVNGEAMVLPLVRLSGLGSLLRAGGVFCPPSSLIDFARALELVHAQDRDTVHTLAVATLIRRGEDRNRFQALFQAWWHASASGTDCEDGNRAMESAAARPALQSLAPTDFATASDEGELDAGLAATCVSVDDARDIGRLDPLAVRELLPAAQALGRQLARARSRRWRTAAAGQRPDFARIRRDSWRHGGEVLKLHRRARSRGRPDLFLLCDVSGSMRDYTLFFLQLAQAFARSRGRVHASVFATALTDITASLRGNKADPLELPDITLPGAGGGTDIGAAFQGFLRQHAARLDPRYSSVLVLSDGLDCGEPASLETAMRAMRRRVARIAWLNPLLGREGYQPLARGMQTALPWVDDFLPANSVASLAAAVRVLAGGGGPGP